MMFREKSISKYYAFTLAAVFALTLAGCGGSGGGGAMMDMDEEMPPVVVDPVDPVDPEPTPEEIAAEEAAQEEAAALTAAQDAAMTALTAAMAAVYGAVDPAARDNAHMYAAMAGTANAAAAAATTSEMAMTHQMAAETASASAVEAGMTRGLGITTTANAAANQSAINSAALVGTPPPSPIPNAGRVGTAIKQAATADASVSAAVSLPADEDPEFETEETIVQMGRVSATVTTDFNTDLPAISVTAAVRHTGTAPRFTVLPEIGDVDDTVAAKKAEVLGRGELPTALVMSGEKPGGGWEGAELVASVSGTAGHKEYAVVYTDINPPAQTYNSAGAINLRDIDGADGDADEDAEGNTVVNRAVVTGEVPGDGSHFVGTYNANPSDNAPPRSGRFFCASGTPCSISVDAASGVVTAIQGYVFQPAIPSTVTRGDSDYLAWGVWLHVPNASPGREDDGDPTNWATVAAFATGNSVFDVKAALTGTATYNGVANGLYTAAGMVEYFDADASLTADFGTKGTNDSTPATDGSDMGLFGAVTGTISNIKAGGMDVDGSLTLGRAPLIAGDDPETLEKSVTDSDPATSFTGSTAGTLGGSAMSGSWAGRFYGKNNAPDGSVAVRTEFPTTAAGTFGATSVLPGVSILGAFGAWKAAE